MSNNDRIFAYVREHPGQTATAIAKALSLKTASVSSYLNLATKEGKIFRLRGQGPRGGYTYHVPVRFVRRNRWQRLVDGPIDVAPNDKTADAYDFDLHISMDRKTMGHPRNISRALERTAADIDQAFGMLEVVAAAEGDIKDVRGNKVGRWEIKPRAAP